MKKQKYFIVVSILFIIVALTHFLRIVFSWDLILGNWYVPMWFSWIAFLLLAFLTFHAFSLKNKPVKSYDKSLEEKRVEKAEEILDLFKEKDEITNDDVEELLGVSDSTATRYLDVLEEKGLIKQFGEGRGAHYKLIDGE